MHYYVNIFVVVIIVKLCSKKLHCGRLIESQVLLFFLKLKLTESLSKVEAPGVLNVVLHL